MRRAYPFSRWRHLVAHALFFGLIKEENQMHLADESLRDDG